MTKITVISHLTPQEWKASWEDKVVEDSKESMRAYQQYECFCGHFQSPTEFELCHHKEYEVKSMSLGMYFHGNIEADPQGSKITGTIGKKRSTNLFLCLGAILCLIAMFGSIAKGDYRVLITAVVLFGILVFVYLTRPKKEQQMLIKHLEKISFDDTFHGKAPLSARKHLKKKRSLKDRATIPSDRS